MKHISLQRLFSRRFRYSSTASAPIIDVISYGSLHGEPLFFPWRNRPDVSAHKNPLNRLLVKSVISRIQSEEEFLRGSKAAFESAVDTIFANYNGESGGERVAADMEDSLHPPILNQVFEERLSTFYANAIKNVALQPSYRMFHKLVSMDEPKVIRTDLLLYSEVDKVEHEFLERHELLYGLLAYLKPQRKASSTTAMKELEKEEDFSNIITNLKSSRNPTVQGSNQADSILLRVWVEVNCKEIFYVKDVDRGIFIQGTDLIQSTTHELLLENSVRLEDAQKLNPLYTDEWRLIDLDQWIEHNDDWLQFRFRR